MHQLLYTMDTDKNPNLEAHCAAYIWNSYRPILCALYAASGSVQACLDIMRHWSPFVRDYYLNFPNVLGDTICDRMPPGRVPRASMCYTFGLGKILIFGTHPIMCPQDVLMLIVECALLPATDARWLCYISALSTDGFISIGSAGLITKSQLALFGRHVYNATLDAWPHATLRFHLPIPI